MNTAAPSAGMFAHQQGGREMLPCAPALIITDEAAARRGTALSGIDAPPPVFEIDGGSRSGRSLDGELSQADRPTAETPGVSD